MVLVQRYKLLKGSGIVDVQGQDINSAEENIFRVVMVGKQTDNYQMSVEVGDLVMITTFALHNHKKGTKATDLSEKKRMSYVG